MDPIWLTYWDVVEPFPYVTHIGSHIEPGCKTHMSHIWASRPYGDSYNSNPYWAHVGPIMLYWLDDACSTVIDATSTS